MPRIAVVIEYDGPDAPYWMSPDGVAICLHAQCPNTKFKVTWANNGDPWAGGHNAPDDIGCPVGCIVDWDSTREVPAGWQWCDGTNGTPDLQGWGTILSCDEGDVRFIGAIQRVAIAAGG